MWLTHKNTPWKFTNECCSTFNLLKKAFTSTLILTHWVPNAPLVVKTNASDYAITGILSIISTNSEHWPVAYYLWTLSTPELNYDTHDKELLAIFKAFKHWQHYLKGFASPVDVVTDHKNLKYFSSSKVLTCHQARWSEYLSQFNLSICFHPGCLRAKPDALTCHWDVYWKEGDRDYTCINPHNLKLMFKSRTTCVLPWQGNHSSSSGNPCCGPGGCRTTPQRHPHNAPYWLCHTESLVGHLWSQIIYRLQDSCALMTGSIPEYQ